ncbi:MAG TPA: GlcNAc-PI de-N-acetylase [Anaerolineaceae bacterium]|nr:GlcNAc-PI de-N-acetylase [Anaerolineaceae bacterium]
MKQIPEYSGKSLLAVLAHPDDETFGMGGTLALYARRGVSVQLICATRGEVGEIDPEYKESLKSAACLRTQELRCAADTLGIEVIHFLNYRDSGMPGSPDNTHPKALAAQPVEQVAREVAHLIRQIQPEVVLTFDPIGGYRHPDHIAIQRATVLGFDLAGDPEFADPEGLPPFHPQKLYFHTMNRTFLKISVRVMRLIGQDPRQFGQNKDIDLVSLTEVDFPTHVKIDYRPVRDVRKAAAACHASQGGAMMTKGVRGMVSRLFGGYYDTYMQANPEPGDGIKMDLFG